MRLGVDFLNPALEDSQSYGRLVRHLLEAVIFVNRLFLQGHPKTPGLYDSGVFYGEASAEDGFVFVDIPTILQRRRGICSHLAAWRVAELREAGVNASLRIVWSKDLSTYHVQVRFPSGVIEDPSQVLGMKKWEF